jgi:formylmethanofuran dehydrogenase subunit A
VIKSGQVIVDQGDIREPLLGKTLHVAPDYDREVERDIRTWFESCYSIQWANYPVGDNYLADHEIIHVDARKS